MVKIRFNFNLGLCFLISVFSGELSQAIEPIDVLKGIVPKPTFNVLINKKELTSDQRLNQQLIDRQLDQQLKNRLDDLCTKRMRELKKPGPNSMHSYRKELGTVRENSGLAVVTILALFCTLPENKPNLSSNPNRPIHPHLDSPRTEHRGFQKKPFTPTLSTIAEGDEDTGKEDAVKKAAIDDEGDTRSDKNNEPRPPKEREDKNGDTEKDPNASGPSNAAKASE